MDYLLIAHLTYCYEWKTFPILKILFFFTSYGNWIFGQQKKKKKWKFVFFLKIIKQFIKILKTFQRTLLSSFFFLSWLEKKSNEIDIFDLLFTSHADLFSFHFFFFKCGSKWQKKKKSPPLSNHQLCVLSWLRQK